MGIHECVCVCVCVCVQDFLSVYTAYCTNFSKANDCLEEALLTNRTLKEFIEVSYLAGGCVCVCVCVCVCTCVCTCVHVCVCVYSSDNTMVIVLLHSCHIYNGADMSW